MIHVRQTVTTMPPLHPTPGVSGREGASARSAPGDALPDLSGKCILIVEDETFIALELAFGIEDAGATSLGPAGTIDDALSFIARGGFDAAILDLDLQGVDAFPVAESLKGRNIPFLFHTGHGDRSELKERFGDVIVCVKPVDPGEIMRNLSGLID